MTTFIALLRGINVGKAKRIAMADLRTLVEDLGYKDVRTLLNSGNVVFTAKTAGTAAIGAKIEKALKSELGISARVIVVTADELATIIDENPLLKVATNHSRSFVAVFDDASQQTRLKDLMQAKWSPEAIALGERVAYHWCPNGILESNLGKALAKALKDSVTTRNWATMLKLRALTEEVKD